MRQPEVIHLKKTTPLPKQISQGASLAVKNTREPKYTYKIPQAHPSQEFDRRKDILYSQDYGRKGRNDLLNKLVQDNQKHPTAIY